MESKPVVRVDDDGFLELVAGGPHFHVDETMDYPADDDYPTGAHSTPAFAGTKKVLRYLQARAGRCVAELQVEAGLDTEHPPQWVNWTVRACFDENCETQEDFSTFLRLMSEVESDD